MCRSLLLCSGEVSVACLQDRSSTRQLLQHMTSAIKTWAADAGGKTLMLNTEPTGHSNVKIHTHTHRSEPVWLPVSICSPLQLFLDSVRLHPKQTFFVSPISEMNLKINFLWKQCPLVSAGHRGPLSVPGFCTADLSSGFSLQVQPVV